MSNSASKKSVAQPTIGDLSALQSEIKKPKSTTQNVGDTQNIAAASVNDVLGDITLLEEAFAEMEISVADYEQEIPLLHSTVEQPSNITQIEIPGDEVTENLSIPVLDQHASTFAESAVIEDAPPEHSNIPTLETASNIDPLVISEITSLEPPPDSATAKHEEITIGEPESPRLDAADVISEAPEKLSVIIKTPEEETQTTTEAVSIPDSPASEVIERHVSEHISETIALTEGESFSALIEESSSIAEPLSTPSSSPISLIEEESFASDSLSIDEKIAQATGDTAINELDSVPLPEAETENDVSTELAPTFTEDVPLSPPPPRTNNAPNLSIPFELHSQLSKKIDDLVLDATLSLTTELQTQLSLQLESLLGGAVEAVLPKLVDQMANELRAEVKNRVKQQLPIIVNEVLGKTRLT